MSKIAEPIVVNEPKEIEVPTYNKKEIKNIVREVIDEEGASFVIEDLTDKDVVAKTLKQSEANWELEVSATPPSSDFEYVGGFQGFKQINGELHIIYVANFKNISDSAKTFQFPYPYIDYDVSSMPLELRKKIYDMGGKTIDETPGPSDESYIRIAPMGVSAQGSGNYMVSCPIIHRLIDHIQISFGNSYPNVPANGYVRLSLEVNLDLI